MFLRHFLKPGMTAIDIGANLGVYALPMAKLVGPKGRVFAYEPASEPRALLQRSRELNGAKNLEDRRRGGLRPRGRSQPFARRLERAQRARHGAGEMVRLVNLDAEDATRGWAPDFIKIDAEGEEERIFAGGKNFFARHSPLVMMEIRAGERVNEALRVQLPRMGYRLYRVLPDTPLLVPVAASETLDDYELNLFAAKDDRAAALARDGWLIEAADQVEARCEHRCACAAEDAAVRVVVRPLVRGPDAARPAIHGLPRRVFRLALARDPAGTTLGRARFRFPHFAYARHPLPSAFRRWPASHSNPATAPRASRRSRRSSTRCAMAGLISPSPFGRLCRATTSIAPGERIGDWFFAAAVEAFERNRGHSSFFSGMTPLLEWLCRQPFASNEMERRRTLVLARAGQAAAVPPRLRVEAHGSPQRRDLEKRTGSRIRRCRPGDSPLSSACVRARNLSSARRSASELPSRRSACALTTCGLYACSQNDRRLMPSWRRLR